MADDYNDIFVLLENIENRAEERKNFAVVRAKYLQAQPLTKQAFDSRRIDQQNDFNPRRNLQYFKRSEAFIDEDTTEKVESFFKVKNSADNIRGKYIGEPAWLDSYTRILCNALDQTLRTEQKDFDYSKAQMNYLSELLYVRYRLDKDSIDKMSSVDLEKAIMDKDETLVRLALYKHYENPFLKTTNYNPQMGSYAAPGIVHAVPAPAPQDTLMDKLFNNVKADHNNKNVKRSVMITIEDSIVEAEKNEKDTDIVKSED